MDLPRMQQKDEILRELGRSLELLESPVRALLQQSNAAPPNLIFHYTSPEGLLGIVKNRVIWATDVQYLNDDRELSYALDLFERAGKEFWCRFTTPAARDLLDMLVHQERGHEGVFSSNYVASFSEGEDVLSQWRAYGSNGSGYAIGFEAGQLPSAVGYGSTDTQNKVRLVKMIYPSNADSESIHGCVLGTLSLVDKFCKQYPSLENEIREVASAALWQLRSDLVPIVKNPGFREEREWRMLYVVEGGGMPLFRATPSFGLTPYVELSWTSLPPIKRMVTGPRLPKGLAAGECNRFLAIGGYSVARWETSVEVTESRISYR